MSWWRAVQSSVSIIGTPGALIEQIDLGLDGGLPPRYVEVLYGLGVWEGEAVTLGQAADTLLLGVRALHYRDRERYYWAFERASADAQFVCLGGACKIFEGFARNPLCQGASLRDHGATRPRGFWQRYEGY